ncbi:uncharacterized protein LOC119735368 [Patiria miniata]|uniref:Uncharacterized protein n=1 Tax=Patiria miniata TaxID=46514 RepID=A0A914AN12_PATMI|nr:uncharacterized protein LOC119735368 [Patiria miniata]
MTHSIFCLKSPQVVIPLLCCLVIGICSPVPGDLPRRKLRNTVGENIGDEEKNQICSDHFGSQEYIWVPEPLNKCEPCSFACSRSTEAYCEACPGATTTQAPAETTSTAPPTQAATTVQTIMEDPILPTASDQVVTGGSVADATTTEARTDGNDLPSRKLNVGMVVGIVILLVIVCILIVFLIVCAHNWLRNKRGAGEPESRDEPNPEELPLSVEDSHPASSNHPWYSDLNGVTADPRPVGILNESEV